MGGARPKIVFTINDLPFWRLFVLFLTGLTLVACTRSGPSDPAPASTSTTGPTTSSLEAAREAALEVCARFAVAALSADSAIDRGPSDARRRAVAQFGTPALIERLGGEGRDHEWSVIAQHRARVQVDTAPIGDDPPAPSADRAGAGVLARRVAVADDGWRQVLASTATYCALVRTSEGWKVADVAFSDSSTSGTPR